MSRGERTPREYRLYGVFNHPTRSKIIDLLHTRSAMTSTELRREISTSVGTLYYHLSILGDLVTQDENKRYFLTEVGVTTAKHVKIGQKEGSNTTISDNLPLIERLSPFISGSLIIHGVSLSPFRHSIEAALIILLGGWLASVAGLEPRMLFLFQGSTLSSTSIILSFILGWLALFVVSDIVATAVFKRSGGHLSLLVSSTYTFIPLILFASIWFYHETYPLSLLGDYGIWPFRIIFFILQVWSFLILASSIKISKRLSTSNSAVIVLLIVYLNISFVFAENVP